MKLMLSPPRCSASTRVNAAHRSSAEVENIVTTNTTEKQNIQAVVSTLTVSIGNDSDPKMTRT